MSGPEEKDHALRKEDHVLPFGFELTMNDWIPIMHARGQEGPDSARDDPFKTQSRLPYDQSCSMCHTTQPLGWLQSRHSGTRLVGADVLLKAKADWALPLVLKTLDDPYMEIRQFTVQRLRDYFGIDPDNYGYKLYMTEAERKEPLRNMLNDPASPPSEVSETARP